MADEPQVNAEGEDPKVSGTNAITQIAYCPHLDVYEYIREDGTYRFNTVELERMVDLYLKDGKTRDADFMAVLTGLARQYPHKRVSFDAEGQCNVSNLEALPVPEATVETTG